MHWQRISQLPLQIAKSPLYIYIFRTSESMNNIKTQLQKKTTVFRDNVLNSIFFNISIDFFICWIGHLNQHDSGRNPQPSIGCCKTLSTTKSDTGFSSKLIQSSLPECLTVAVVWEGTSQHDVQGKKTDIFEQLHRVPLCTGLLELTLNQAKNTFIR